MRLGGRRRANVVRPRLSRGLLRRTAVVMAVVLAVSLTAPQASLVPAGRDALPLSWLWSWFDLPAGWASPPSPVTPGQGSAGGAAGKAPVVASGSMRAGGGG